jgi:hypothetical protein
LRLRTAPSAGRSTTTPTCSRSGTGSTRRRRTSSANSTEILGDAQPTQSNYEQVLNTVNADAAIGRLQRAASNLNAALGG